MSVGSGQVDNPPRVLLVGRSEIERDLRRRAEVELLRARTATDAIGEAAHARSEGEPVSAVLIAPGALDESERSAWRDSIARFIDSAPIIDLSRDPDAERVLARLAALEREREPEAEPTAASATPSAPAAAAPTAEESPTATKESPTAERSAPGELIMSAAPIDALLAGASPIEAALERARLYLGDETIFFIESGAAPPAGARSVVGVQRRGVSFGSLIAEKTPADRLESVARELASWIALERQQQQLREAAFKDSLTGAFNRRWFEEALPRALDAARAGRRDVTLMVYDIDDFKSYNDRYGHAAGDEILRETVRLMSSVIRPTDRVCRIGGDEFAVLFDDPAGPRAGAGRHVASIAQIAARFQRQICDHRFPKLAEDAPGTLTVSGGLATFPWDAGDARTLIELADALAIESKRHGKNALTYGPGAQHVCGWTPGYSP